MFFISMHGSRYALIGQRVTYDLDAIELPPNVAPHELKITWWKNGIEVPQYSWEDQMTLELYDVGYPAEGEYYCTAEAGEYHARSNSIYLEIGTENRQVKVTVNSRTIIEAEIGDVIELHPSCQVQPSYAHWAMEWTRENSNVPLGPNEFVTIHVNDESDFGNYVLHTEAYAHGGFTSAHARNVLKIVPVGAIEEQCPLIYTHDLIPGRNRGYIRVGWWVIEEIFEANRKGLDWETDPFDPRLKYHCEIANIVHGLSKWPDMEIQDTRHGYILTHEDLHKTNYDKHKGLKPRK